MKFNDEQLKDIQERIDAAAKEVLAILEKHQLAIAGKVIKQEIAPSVFGDTVQVGYVDTKYLPKKPSAEAKDNKVELKED